MSLTYFLKDEPMRIVFFDSGIGGLTVLRRAVQELPDHQYIYYADTRNAPYGTKPKDEVRKFIFDGISFLETFGIDILVVACNTATSVAIADLRRRYPFPIIGMEPAVKPAIIKSTGKKILVMATSMTIKESKLSTLIHLLDKNRSTVRMEMDQLVNFAESFDFGSEKVISYIRNKLTGIHLNEFETIVLGCTHYVYYAPLIQEIAGKEIRIMDGNSGTVNHLKTVIGSLPQEKTGGPGEISFYSSGARECEERERLLRRLIRRDSDTL